MSIRLAHRGVLAFTRKPDLTFGGYYMHGDLQMNDTLMIDGIAYRQRQPMEQTLVCLLVLCDTHLFWISSCNFLASQSGMWRIIMI